VPAAAPAHLPVSTYRLQLSSAFGFAEARGLVDYLEKLGITTCYSSPILMARPGSSHGYDTCDHGRLSEEYGGSEAFAAWSTALRAAGLGLLVDFVPNHMSIDPVSNRWWRDVLENGPSSEHARTFDIDWRPVKPELHGKVLLPLLGDQYGVVLERGELQVTCSAEGEFTLAYGDRHLPLNMRQLRVLIGHRLDVLEASVDASHGGLNELQSILFHLEHLPTSTDTSPDRTAQRAREQEIVKERLARLMADWPEIAGHLVANVRLFNGTPGDGRSFDLLHDLLEGQPYRLSYWRTAMHEINYRRFFDVNDLAGVRMEEPSVFAAAHRLVTDLVAQDLVQGLRLDHVDGLFDPAGYLDRLAAELGPMRPYVVVEKILSPDESLPGRWAIHGTTGYDFMNDVNGLFVDTSRSAEFRKLYARFIGAAEAFEDVAYASKKLVITSSMSSELNVLAHWLNRISEQDRDTRDFTLDSLQEALREVVACFPVYRSYVGYDGWTAVDERWIDTAVGRARAKNPATEPSVFEFVQRMLRPRRLPELGDEAYVQRRRFAMKFQQYTGPVEAKGVEDTAFYRHTTLLSLNEVGGDPSRFGRSVADFHAANQARRNDWPLAMLATSTHDSKRGEDARARINVLSELPGEWRTLISRWSRANAAARTMVDGQPAPDRNDEYLFYQALIGAWPAGLEDAPDETFVSRMAAYMQKAAKEAKRHTSWINPSDAYDRAITAFVTTALAGRTSRGFLRQFVPLAARVSRLGAVNALAQLVMKIASPGVPDCYQGTEVWDLALVDPDNRRAIDFATRARWLDEALDWIEEGSAARIARLHDLLAHWTDGRIKLYLMAAGLRHRRAHAKLFVEGTYEPLEVSGDRAAHVVAFARRLGPSVAVAVVPRLVHGLYGHHAALRPAPDMWRDTTIALPPPLAGLRYRHTFTSESIVPEPRGEQTVFRVADLVTHLPVALLEATAEESES
jgi:(1->4)-alpha-D-glucan 1-alpha-D-glucosylmutase